MTLIYRKNDLIRLTVPTVSGWQGIGIVLEPVHQDDDPDTVVAFRKQGELDDATPSIAMLNEVEPVYPTNRQLDRVLTRIWNEPGNGRELLRDFLTRWGSSSLAKVRSSLEDSPVPVPVSERLPGEGDLHPTEQWCWTCGQDCCAWHRVTRHFDAWSYWLPFNALPLPAGEGEP